MSGTANSIITTQSVVTAGAVCTAAKTTYGDVTNAQLLLTAGSNGGLLTRLTALARSDASGSDRQLQLFRDVGGLGTNIVFIDSILMDGFNTTTTTTSPTRSDFGYSQDSPLKLGAGDKLYVGISVALAGGVAFNAEAEQF